MADRARALSARYAPLVPALATVLLLCAPADRGDVTAPGRITPADAASAVLLLCCLIRLVRQRARPLTLTAALVLGSLAVGFAVSTMASDDPAASLPGFVRAVQIFVLVPAALVLTLRTPRDFRVVAGSVVLLALVQGAIGVHQFMTGTGASYMGKDIRAVGTFGSLDVMGMATVVAYGLVAALALGLAPAADAPRHLRPAALCSAALLVVPLAVSFSRGAWIATAVSVLVVLLLAGPRLALRTVAVLGALAVVLVGGAGVGSQMMSERVTSITEVSAAPDRSVTDRYALWSAAASIWSDAPVTGVGLKGFAAHRDGHASLGLSSGSDTGGAGAGFQREPLLSPHNMYLLVLSEQGLVGITALLGSWAALLVCALRRLPAARRGGRHADCGLIAIGLLVWQAVDFLYADIGGPTTVLTAVLFGLVSWWALATPEPARGADTR
ncbi:O-antigen ligase family protein [Streptomyces sp. NPDC048248]|uniref:O-antigen ligase family protein n=1 Tax=Streptomyces sp. NPDC048248 TaxID=3365523 RepID=UPI003714294A